MCIFLYGTDMVRFFKTYTLKSDYDELVLSHRFVLMLHVVSVIRDNKMIRKGNHNYWSMQM